MIRHGLMFLYVCTRDTDVDCHCLISFDLEFFVPAGFQVGMVDLKC